MEKIKGIIFDLDGTLTSTNELIFASFNYITNKYLKKRLTPPEIIGLFGPTEDQIMEKWFGDDYPQVRKDYYDYYSENHHMADIYPGIKELIESIKLKKIPVSIFTGKGREATTITLKKLNLYEDFDMIITGDDVEEHKPSGEGILKFIDRYNLNKENVLMIGDSPADIKAARSAGVKIASVVWDSYAKEEVLKLDSDYIFQTVEELFEFIKMNS